MSASTQQDIDRSLAIFYHPLYQELIGSWCFIFNNQTMQNMNLNFLNFVEFNMKVQKCLLPNFEEQNAFISALNDWVKEVTECFNYKDLYNSNKVEVVNLKEQIKNYNSDLSLSIEQYNKFIDQFHNHEAFTLLNINITSEVFCKFLFDLCSTWCETLDIELFLIFLFSIFIQLTEGETIKNSKLKKINDITNFPYEFFTEFEKLKEDYQINKKKQLRYYRAWCEHNYLRLNEIGENTIIKLIEIYGSAEEKRILELVDLFERAIDTINGEINSQVFKINYQNQLLNPNQNTNYVTSLNSQQQQQQQQTSPKQDQVKQYNLYSQQSQQQNNKIQQYDKDKIISNINIENIQNQQTSQIPIDSYQLDFDPISKQYIAKKIIKLGVKGTQYNITNQNNDLEKKKKNLYKYQIEQTDNSLLTQENQQQSSDHQGNITQLNKDDKKNIISKYKDSFYEDSNNNSIQQNKPSLSPNQNQQWLFEQQKQQQNNNAIDVKQQNQQQQQIQSVNNQQIMITVVENDQKINKIPIKQLFKQEFAGLQDMIKTPNDNNKITNRKSKSRTLSNVLSPNFNNQINYENNNIELSMIQQKPFQQKNTNKYTQHSFYTRNISTRETQQQQNGKMRDTFFQIFKQQTRIMSAEYQQDAEQLKFNLIDKQKKEKFVQDLEELGKINKSFNHSSLNYKPAINNIKNIEEDYLDQKLKKDERKIQSKTSYQQKRQRRNISVDISKTNRQKQLNDTFLQCDQFEMFQDKNLQKIREKQIISKTKHVFSDNSDNEIAPNQTNDYKNVVEDSKYLWKKYLNQEELNSVNDWGNLYKVIQMLKQRFSKEQKNNYLSFLNIDVKPGDVRILEMGGEITDQDKERFSLRIQKLLQRDKRRKERRRYKKQSKVIRQDNTYKKPKPKSISFMSKFKNQEDRQMFKQVFLPKLPPSTNLQVSQNQPNTGISSPLYILQKNN